MISRGTKEFWALYHALPSEARSQARKAFLLFAENPDHPSLRFKKLHGAYPYWSVRFGTGYCAVCWRGSPAVVFLRERRHSSLQRTVFF